MSNSKTRRRRELEMARAARHAERRRAARRRQQRLIALGVVIALLAIGGTVTGIVFAVRGDGNGTQPEASASATPGATTKVGDCVYTQDSGSTGSQVVGTAGLPPSAATVSTKPATMTINTNYGAMVFALDAAKAPCTVHAFVHLASKKYFDKSTCHRETAGPEAGIYVLQCGDPTGTGQGSPGFTYKNENTQGVNYNRGVLAMANAGADTNGSQFFINYADPTEEGAQALAGGYTVFGQITEGLDVLDKITSPGVVEGGSDGAPASNPQITSIMVTQEAAPAATTAPSATAAPSASPTSGG